jgi:DNA-binding MarR family transcriptional regulator
MPAAEEQIIRRLLMAIEDDAGVSQRRLSSDIGIAVGSVNWYLKRCLGKGLIKLQHAPVRRYLYYLTPQGFEEKSRLTATFLQRSFELYRLGRQECSEFFRNCATKGKVNLFLAGDGDLAEIACLSGLGTSIQILAVVDGSTERDECAGVAVYPRLETALAATGIQAPDVILITDFNRPKGTYAQIFEQARALDLPEDTIQGIPLLKLTPVKK